MSIKKERSEVDPISEDEADSSASKSPLISVPERQSVFEMKEFIGVLSWLYRFVSK